jgi:hypothetical protein
MSLLPSSRPLPYRPRGFGILPGLSSRSDSSPYPGSTRYSSGQLKFVPASPVATLLFPSRSFPFLIHRVGSKWRDHCWIQFGKLGVESSTWYAPCAQMQRDTLHPRNHTQTHTAPISKSRTTGEKLIKTPKPASHPDNKRKESSSGHQNLSHTQGHSDTSRQICTRLLAQT